MRCSDSGAGELSEDVLATELCSGLVLLQSASAGRSEKTYHPGIELTGTFSANTQQLLADQLVEIEGQCNHLLLAQGKALLKSRSELLK